MSINLISQGLRWLFGVGTYSNGTSSMGASILFFKSPIHDKQIASQPKIRHEFFFKKVIELIINSESRPNTRLQMFSCTFGCYTKEIMTIFLKHFPSVRTFCKINTEPKRNNSYFTTRNHFKLKIILQEFVKVSTVFLAAFSALKKCSFTFRVL